MSYEILSFARNNSIIAMYLDSIVREISSLKLEDCPQKDMPFCKYVFLSAESIGYEGQSNLALIEGNEKYLRSGYETRDNADADEMPYLTRWLDKEHIQGAPVKCIAVILYDREQLTKEGIDIKADYGVVTAQAEPHMGISPMTPATIIRNALGTEYGGNGTPVDREYYAKAVEFWSKWAIVK